MSALLPALGEDERPQILVGTSVGAINVAYLTDGGPDPAPDHQRGIDYVRSELGEAHVRSSAAIPLVFPAVAWAPNG